MIEVLPKDGYGESTTTDEPMKDFNIKPQFMITVDKSRFSDTIIQTVERKSLGEE